MNRMKKLLSVLLAVLMVFSLMSTALAVQTDEPLAGKVVILHSNDVHGAIEGYAKIAALRDTYTAAGAEVILADAGDFCQGNPYVSLSKGATAVEMMNAAGYDVATLGNHEFDYGYDNLMAILKNAEFKTICGNVFKDDESILDGWTILEKAGVKIGFVGLETPETYTKVNPGLIQGVSFPQKEELYKRAQTLVNEVKAAGADVVVGLFHLGVDDESVGNRSVDVFANVQGLDIVLDGHSHTVMTAGANEEPIQSTGTAFANVGVVVIDPAEKKIVENKLVPADEIEVPEDSAVLAKAKAIEAAVDEEYGAVFAQSEVELNGDRAPGNRNMETNLGDLICDAMIWSVMKEGDLKVDSSHVVAVTNGGGIRAWIHAGDVTMKDVNSVLPFGNTVAVIYVTGAELLEALEASCYMAPEALGGFPQVANMKFTIDLSLPFDQGEQYPDSTYFAPKSIQRVSIDEVCGKPFDPNATYAVISNNFTAAGGDTYFAFKAASEQFDTSIPLDEALMNYIREELGGVIGEKYAEPQGRISQIGVSMNGKVVILHSNDVHGAVEGYAKIAALRDKYQAEGAEVILADAGDFCQGNPYVSLSKGATAVEMMNAAGYDVATLGNHEFDYGYDNLVAILKNAEFKTICGNVFKDGERILDGWTIIEKAGVKIGFVGLETPETYTKVNPGLIQGISFPQKEELYACAQTLVDEVRAAGADVVVGLFHLGVDDESIGNRSVDVFANVQGLDIVLDGHSHTVMTAGANGEPIQSTGTAFANVGVVVIDPAEKAIVSNYLKKAESVPVAEDSAVLAKAKAIEAAVDEEYGAVFAKSEVELNGDRAPGNRNEETNLGDLITDAMVWAVLKDAELKVPAENVVGVTNGGGIRAWIHAGDVTMKDVNSVLPFGNTVAVVYVTGAELLEALEASCYMAPGAVGGFPQVSGMKFTIDTDKPFDQGEQYPESTYYAPKSIQRVTIDEVNGKPFDKDATYAVVTNNFCAAGGDTYFAFKAASDQFDTSIPMDEALMNFIEEELNGVITEKYSEPAGRISIPYMDLLHQVQALRNMLPETRVLTEASAKAVTDAAAAADAAKTVADLQKAFDDLTAAAKALEFKPTTFKDVKSGDWFKPAVDFAQATDLMNGVGENMFAPQGDMTRAMVVTVLYRFAGEPDVTGIECPFKDLKQDWYKNAVIWAASEGVTTGTSDDEFSPDVPITREEMAAFIARYLFGPDEGEEDLTTELRAALAMGYYSDAAAISDWAVDEVAACTFNGIMRGDAPQAGKRSTFRPLDTMKRSECAQVLLNMYSAMLELVLPPQDVGTTNAAVAALRPAA